jgi:chemotaxis family two-component system response regulator Rcp1
MSSREINILLVEDNLADVVLTQEALEESKLITHMHTAKDGEEAMAFLRKTGKYKDVPTPDLVLLDLNLPKKDGRQVLKEIKEDPQLKVIPVVILTTSAAEEDILKTYKLHANCYIMKPVDFAQFTRVVKAIESFWFSVVKLPPTGA